MRNARGIARTSTSPLHHRGATLTDHRGRVAAIAQRPERPIERVELVERPLLDHPAALEHDHAIGVAQRAQPVRR